MGVRAVGAVVIMPPLVHAPAWLNMLLECPIAAH